MAYPESASQEQRSFENWWSSDADLVREIHRKVLCRDQQLALLLSLFSERKHNTPSSIFIYGHTATGKTHLITTLMRTLQLPSAIINCIECSSSRYLFEHVLNSLPLKKSEENRDKRTTCDNMNDFVHLLKMEVVRRQLLDQTVYIVLDKAERLREMEFNILPAFLRLQELTGLNICTVMLSDIVWEKFRAGTGFCEPFPLWLPDYSQDELAKIMMLDCPERWSIEVYGNYVSLFLSVFYQICRDLRELRHLALLNFPKYIEPVEKGEATEKDSRKLWRNIEPHLKRALQTVYLREVSSAQWERTQMTWSEGNEAAGSRTGVGSTRSSIELPYYSKYLLIAAYLASYNPVISDRRFFSKKASRISKRSKVLKKHEQASNHLLGPKPFPLDRLLAIFYSIVDDKISPSAIIFSQISSLVSLQLVGQVCADGQIDMLRYKCLVSLDVIRSVARETESGA